MSSDNPKWKEKMDITYEEFFNQPVYIPNMGVVLLTRALERELGKEKAHEILFNTAKKANVDMIKGLKKHGDVNSLRDFLELVNELTDNPIFEHAVSGETVELTDDRLVHRNTKCLFAKAWREMDAADIGYLLNCRGDIIIAETASPHLTLKLSKTIMQGDEYCLYEYTWREE